MRDAVHSSVHTLKDMLFRKSDESLVCSDKTLQSFYQTCIVTFRHKYSTTSESSIDEQFYCLFMVFT
jgi:hypothetical protein